MIDFKKDKTVEPNDVNLSEILGESFAAFKTLEDKLKDFDATLTWRFYKDGGWLAKMTRKNKTLSWGWPDAGFFGTNFIFANKPTNKEGVMKLDIPEIYKKNIQETPNGAYFSIQIEVRNDQDLEDVYRLITFKMKAK